MAYTQYTLSNVITQISDLMDDPTQVYWTVPEITWAVYEALRVWGGLTNYWRARGQFPISPSDSSPFYDLSVQLPALRPRTITVSDLVKEIQYMLLENPSGVSGAGMSGQISVASILDAIQVARNRFVLDAALPISYFSIPYATVDANGMVEFSDTAVFIHRVSWKNYNNAWTNLWRSDAWDVDKNNYLWTTETGDPQQYSEAENSPLELQLSPIPQSAGSIDALTVESVKLSRDGTALLAVPDEWAYAIKYSALGYLLCGEGQIKDTMRGQYAEQRYQQAISFAKDARSILRVLYNNSPLNLDSLNSIDAGTPFWRNQRGTPQMAGALYDFVVVGPVDQLSAISCDMSQSAPIPASSDFIQIGQEDLDHIIDYACHVLTFKCGGDDFKTTMGSYDGFMQAVGDRKGVNDAKIKYLTPLFGQPQVEWAQRPDRVKVNA